MFRFRKLSDAFCPPSGKVKETQEVLRAREQLSVESTVKQILELYVSPKNMRAITESTPVVARSAYFLFKQYIDKPVTQIPRAVLEQIIDDVNNNRVLLLKEESSARTKLANLMGIQLLALQTTASAVPRV